MIWLWGGVKQDLTSTQELLHKIDKNVAVSNEKMESLSGKLTSHMEEGCPESPHIKIQNGKIDRQGGKIDKIDKCQAETKEMVQEIINRSTFKKELIRGAMVGIPILIAFLGLWLAFAKHQNNNNGKSINMASRYNMGEIR